MVVVPVFSLFADERKLMHHFVVKTILFKRHAATVASPVLTLPRMAEQSIAIAAMAALAMQLTFSDCTKTSGFAGLGVAAGSPL